MPQSEKMTDLMRGSPALVIPWVKSKSGANAEHLVVDDDTIGQAVVGSFFKPPNKSGRRELGISNPRLIQVEHP